MEHFKSLKGSHKYHRESHGQWMYRIKADPQWNVFHDDQHFANTVNHAMDCEVSFFTEVPDMALPAAIM